MRRVVCFVLIIFAASILLPAVLLAQDDAAAKAALRQKRKASRELLKEATRSFDKGAYDVASAALDSLLVLDDANPDAYYYLGRINLIKGDTSSAEAIATTGVEKAPKSSRLRLFLARLKIGLGDYARAIELAESVLAIKPREGLALYLKGLALKGSGDPGAIDFLEKAAETTLARKAK